MMSAPIAYNARIMRIVDCGGSLGVYVYVVFFGFGAVFSTFFFHDFSWNQSKCGVGLDVEGDFTTSVQTYVLYPLFWQGYYVDPCIGRACIRDLFQPLMYTFGKCFV